MIDGKIVVHLRAPVMTQSGYGAHSREVIDYLLSRGDRYIVALEGINWGHCGYLHEADLGDKFHKYRECMAIYEQIKDKKVFDMTIHVSIPNEFTRTSNVCIGVTAGIEVDRITREWVHKCNEMDLIVVPSSFSARVMAGTVYTVRNNQTGEAVDERVETPITVIHEYFQEPEKQAFDFEFSTKKNLLFVGQWGGKGGFGEDRKNVADLIKFFLAKFKDDKDAGLVLKTQLVNGSKKDKHETERRIKEIKSNFGKDVKCKLHLIHEDLSEEELWGLYNHESILGMVSFAHGEGYGRPLLEMAACGKPVIATDWSGHLDFLKKENGFMPVSYDLKEIPECQVWEGVISKDSRWACVREKDAMKQMRKFLSSPSLMTRRAQKGKEWIHKEFSKEAAEKKWDEFFGQFIKSADEKKVEQSDIDPQFVEYLSRKQAGVSELEKLIDKESEKKRVLYIVPQSAGDCLISTSIINSLIMNRHWDTDYDFYVATMPQFGSLFDGLVEEFGVKVIPYDQNLMFNNELLREVWDYVYSPGINVQFTFSNWLMGNGDYSLKLLEEFAKNCNLTPAEIRDYRIKISDCEIPDKPYVVLAPGGQKSAKTYRYWSDVIHNLRLMITSEFDIVQVGSMDEELLEGVLDYRGKEFSESFYVIQKSVCLIGVDSFPAHAAAAVGTPHLVLYASTHATSCVPVMIRKKPPQIAIEETEKCKPKCYKDQCKKAGKNCLSYIEPKTVCYGAFKLLTSALEEKEKQHEDV